METLKDLFEDTLQDIYWAEQAIVKALPKMIEKATAPELKKAFQAHLAETEGQVERLKQVFEILGKKAMPPMTVGIFAKTARGFLRVVR